ncbi:MAG: hypothetical protein AAFN74_01270 [Myxococcota bacterium]
MTVIEPCRERPTFDACAASFEKFTDQTDSVALLGDDMLGNVPA